MSQAPASQTEWLSGAAARDFLGCSDAAFKRIVQRRLISVKAIPGARPRYSRADLETLVERSIQAASA